MDWPPQSPDLNPIEQLWDYLDRELRKEPSSSGLWGSIAPSVLNNYVSSMRRCEAVIAARVGNTKEY